MERNEMKLYTIGHSNLEMDKFINLLNISEISIIVDVRTTPYSRYNYSFNKDIIESKLSSEKIDYYFSGKRLGGRPNDPSCYKNNEIPEKGADYLNLVNYPEVMKRKWFLRGIETLLSHVHKKNTAIMCSEENPELCHRHHLLAKFLIQHHPEIEIIHIRRDGHSFNANQLHTSVNKLVEEQLTLFE